MDFFKDLVKYSIRMAFTFFLAALVWWTVTLVFPQFSIMALVHRGGSSSSTTSTYVSEGWLPSPRKYSSLFNSSSSRSMPKEYVPQPAFNGYGLGAQDSITYSTYTYTTYSQSGDDEDTVRKVSSSTRKELDAMVARSSLVRNLSIYDGGHVYTGLSFAGEARSSLFRNGKFPIVVIDATGRVIGVSSALANTDWTVSGWTRFDTKINYTLPVNAPCTMIFEEALTDGERMSRQPNRVSIPIRCN